MASNINTTTNTNTNTNTTQARSLYADSKTRLCERVQNNVESIGSVLRQIIKGSKSVEILLQTSKNFAAQENVIENTEMNVKKMQNCLQQLTIQLDDISKSCEIIDDVIAKSK